jgi:1-acyl-sn-glycerol-3-phosphate acyltransferase
VTARAAVPLRDDIDWYVRLVTLVSRVCVSVFTRVRTEGAFDRIPADGPLILAANHCSNADAAILQGWLVPRVGRRIHWLGKKEILEWPILGRLARGVSIHPIDRGARDVEAFRTALRILEEGHVLLIFPEGTRSPTGEMRDGKEGLATLALRGEAMIVPLGIVDSHRLWPKGGPPRWGARVRLVVGAPFRPADVLPPDLDRRSAKAAATDEVMRRIAGLLPPEQRGRWG